MSILNLFSRKQYYTFDKQKYWIPEQDAELDELIEAQKQWFKTAKETNMESIVMCLIEALQSAIATKDILNSVEEQKKQDSVYLADGSGLSCRHRFNNNTINVETNSSSDTTRIYFDDLKITHQFNTMTRTLDISVDYKKMSVLALNISSYESGYSNRNITKFIPGVWLSELRAVTNDLSEYTRLNGTNIRQDIVTAHTMLPNQSS